MYSWACLRCCRKIDDMKFAVPYLKSPYLHISVSFSKLLGNSINIINDAEAHCLGKRFSLSAKNSFTFHSREHDPTALLCSDSKLRGMG